MLSLERLTDTFQDAIQPMLADGGGARLVAHDLVAHSAEIEMLGTCLYCPNLSRSAGALIERLRERMPELRAIRVVVRGAALARWREGTVVELVRKAPIMDCASNRSLLIHPANRARLSVLRVAS
jgi:Fe-S cluster biogenesis protein NfuA